MKRIDIGDNFLWAIFWIFLFIMLSITGTCCGQDKPWKVQIAVERNLDLHNNTEGKLELHHDNIIFLGVVKYKSMITVGFYTNGKNSYFVHSNPMSNASVGLHWSLPIPKLSSFLRKNHLPTLHINSRLKLLGHKIGDSKGEIFNVDIWRYYNVNLEIRGKILSLSKRQPTKSLKLGMTFGHEWNCASVGGKLLFTI